jgi:hypothetical protein
VDKITGTASVTFLCIRNVLYVFPELLKDGVSVATSRLWLTTNE